MPEESQEIGLRLFLSADLAGSTAFKQNRKPEEWQKFFRNFYIQLPAYVTEHIGSTSSASLPLWKTIGDEIVFSTPLHCSEHVPSLVRAFRSAVAAYRKEICAWPKDLDLKCAGWTAGFPVGNLAVRLGDDHQMDYIGPGVDIGFRLVKEASPRRMLISVELAYLLTIPAFATTTKMFLDRGLDLKGVCKGNRYPCIWLDNFADDSSFGGKNELALIEEQLRGDKPKACQPDKLHHYCMRWLKEMGDPFVIPFIDSDSHIGERPPNYNDLLAKVRTNTQGPESLSKKVPKAGKGKILQHDILKALNEAVKLGDDVRR